MIAHRSTFDLSRRVVLGAALAAWAWPARAGDRLVVLAAASLKPALDEIAAGWAAPVAVSYGGSGTIARQAAAGAPADVVLLAAEDWMDWLVGQGVLAGAARSVAGNRLVLAGPAEAPPLALERAAVLERLGRDGRLAMGDPMSVPAGRYAQQALETLSLWDAVAPRALMAENVRAALAYVARGDVPLGLVYGSDTRGTGVSLLAEVPGSAHAPITYPGAVLARAGPGATAFLDHVAASGEVFARHGFGPAPAS
ncbi:MAG: molybdate ABC transporter substrate-binding protein [Pseudomonadota bacterium]